MNIDERARRAAASVREQAEQVDTDAMLDRVRGAGRRPRWVVPAVAGAGAAAVVVLVVALVLPRLQVDRVEIAPDPVVPGDPEPSPDGTATSDGQLPAVGTWRQVASETFTGPGDDRMRAVAQAGGTAVAVGRSAGGPGIWWRDPHRPAEDPDAWEQVGADLCGEASCELHDVTTSAGRFVAVGMLDGLPKVWVSDDGRTWQRIDLDRSSGGTAGETTLTAVASHPDGLVGFGSEQLAESGSRAVVFTSTDGLGWTEQPASPGSGEQPATVVDAAHVGDGRVVAVGYVGDGTVLWEERDGTWTERHLAGADPTFGVISTFVTSIRSGDRGELLLAGSERGERDEDGRVWRSVDGGTTWDAMLGDMGGPGDQRVTALLRAGGQMIAVGRSRGAETGESRPAAWTFRDDRWEPVEGGDAFADPGGIEAVVETDGHSAIAVGTAGGGGDPNEGAAPADAAVWTYAVGERTGDADRAGG